LNTAFRCRPIAWDGHFTASQLKIIQEAISISVFVVFALLILGEKLRWNYVAAFALVLAAVYLAIAVK